MIFFNKAIGILRNVLFGLILAHYHIKNKKKLPQLLVVAVG